jgi:hypothetical protein
MQTMYRAAGLHACMYGTNPAHCSPSEFFMSYFDFNSMHGASKKHFESDIKKSNYTTISIHNKKNQRSKYRFL